MAYMHVFLMGRLQCVYSEYFHGLAQDCGNSSVLAMELPQSLHQTIIRTNDG